MNEDYEEITSMLSSEEKIAEEMKKFLLEHIKEISTKTGKSVKELRGFIDRLIVM